MSFEERYADLQRDEINQHLKGLHSSRPEPVYTASMSEDADRQPGLAPDSERKIVIYTFKGGLELFHEAMKQEAARRGFVDF